jgi:hypothetical protein
MRQAQILRVEFNCDLEHANASIGQIVKALQRPMWKGMHGKRTIAFVYVTHLSVLEESRRLWPTLENVSGIDNYWFHVAPPAVIARHGFIDPLASAVKKAGDLLREGYKAKNVS